MFDVATMLFYSYADSAVRGVVPGHPGARPAAGGAIYLAHLIHRQVDWSIRFHRAEAIDQWSRIGASEAIDDQT